MPVGLRDRRTWRRRGPPARTLVIGTDARYWHQRALSAPARVVDMSARYIPLAVSTTPSQCRQRAPTPVPGECPSPASDCSSEGLCPPRAWGIPSEGGEHHGMPRMPSCPGGCPIFLLQWEERNERCPLASGDCLCPSPRQGNARTRQGWPGPGGRRGRPGGGTPARARAGPSPASPRLSATPGGTRTRTLIYRTRTAHKGAIPPLCAAPCSLIPFLVCDTEKERGQDPRGTRRTGHSCCTA